MNESTVACLICSQLASFDAVQVGIFPISVNVAGSDVDIICTYSNQDMFVEQLEKLYAGLNGFCLNRNVIRGEYCVVCRFILEGIPAEVFGQLTPVQEQYAWRHMQVEHRLLTFGGDNFRKLVMSLRSNGLKTEQAFAEALHLRGDPYEALLLLYNEPDQVLKQLITGI